MVSKRVPQSFVLDGQGIPVATNQTAVDTAMQDALCPVGHAVLLSCHQALLQDYKSLTDEESVDAGLTPADVPTPHSLLDLPLRIQYNAIVANTHLYLTQILRYIANLDESAPLDEHWVAQEIGILGFSTGMFAATVMACSHDVPTLVRNATEMFRFAFWLGLRAQEFVTRALAASASASGSLTPASSWSLVTFGASRDDIQAAIERYLSECPLAPRVYVTAVTNDSCISVSGHPDGLNLFRSKYLPDNAISSRGAAIHTLYHSPELIDVKASVMRDLDRHGVHLPTYCDLKNPLRSTYTGEIISAEEREDGCTLAEELVDMTLIHPVNFDRVITSIRSDCGTSEKAPFSLINLGPGTVLWRSTARALSDLNFTLLDWSLNGVSERAGSDIPRAPHGSASSNEGFAREAIAIVGMAAKFPGAVDTEALWEVLEQGINTVSEVPSARFKVSDYNSGAHGSKRSLKTKFGNFIEDPDVFDNAFFRVSPREARSMDPQQRLLLHTSYHALENAGYVPGATTSFDPETFGSYVGVATNDYTFNLRNDVDVYYSTGTLHAFLSGKIAYAFGFCGPSIVVDTACSSSMVALYQACRGLINRDCNAAIAGGVNIISSPDTFIGLDRAHFLSATGQCKPWDTSADGYCRAEGCGMFVLKRLADAVSEGDRILGVIRGIEANQSAKADSITQPHIPTQINLFKKLVSATRIEPQRVNVIEAHGTGTKAGDPTEIRSLRAVFAQNRTSANPLHLTSIKANIGHAEAASGAASLTKLLLMLRNRTIPAVISLKQLNPNIPDLASDGTCIPTTNVPWNSPPDGGRRIALLNNFGAAGSNVAALVEEAPEAPLAPSASGQVCVGAFVVGIACDSEEAVETQRAAYVRHIETKVHDAQGLADFAYSATARRRAHRYRIAASASTKEGVCEALKRAQIVQVSDSAPGKIVFVFSGQGGQYIGMGKELYKTLPAFAKVVDECHEKLLSWGFPGILGLVSPAENASVEEDFRAFQQAVFVLEYALAMMWTSWGITPDAVAGHSLGEYAALVVAGVLGLDDALRLVAGRAQLMGLKCVSNETGMLAVKLSPAELQRHIASNSEFDQLSIACYNSCDDGVVAGKNSQLEQLQAELKAAGRKCIRVNVPYGYHTSAMAPILDEITALASRARIHAPTIPIVSNVHGSVVAAGNTQVFSPEYFARHCGEPVKFEQGINDLMGRDDFATVAAWIEIGPHPTTLPMLRSIPATSNQAVYLPTLRKNTDAWQTIGASLADLYCVSNTMRWRAVFSDIASSAKLVDLPAYPFAKTKFWIQYEEGPAVEKSSIAPVSTSTRYTLLSHSVRLPAPGTSESAIFDTPIATAAALIEGHKVAEYGLCPASVFIEMATAAAQITLEHLNQSKDDTIIALSDIAFAHPLVYSAGVTRTVRIELTLHNPGEKHTGSWAVSSYVDDPSKSQPHCSGVFNHTSKTQTSSKLAFVAPMVEHRRSAVTSSRLSETFYTRTAYEIIFSRIVAYSPVYHTMKSVTIDPNGVDAYAVIQLPKDTVAGTFVAHPVFMDTLLHAAGFVINCKAGLNEAFICSQVDKVKAIPELLKRDVEYGVYCTISFVSDSLAMADAYAFERTASGVTVVASIKRMRFKKLRLSAFKAILSSAASHTGVPSRASAPPVQQPVSHKRIQSVDSTQAFNAEQVRDIMATVLGIPAKDLRDDEDLERYGLDSLMSIEAQHSLSSTLKTKLPDNFFSTCKTIRDICKFVTPAATTATLEPSRPPSDVTLHEPAPPLADQKGDDSLRKVKEIIASVIGVSIEELGDDKDLERLGMDSLMSIEAHHALALALKASLPQDLFVTCKTVREIRDFVAPPSQSISTPDKLSIPSQAYGTDVNPVELQPANGSSNVPLFLIHDGSGIAHSYARLSSLGRQVWGIHNPKFASGGKWEGGILEQAAHYTSLIRGKLAGNNECLVGGWSIGGVLAFEVARQLIASGVRVPGVLLIDSPHPQTTTPLSDDVINAAFTTNKSSPSRAMELARTQIQFATRSLVEYDPSTSPAKNARPPKAVMLRSREAFRVKTTDLTSQSDAFLAERSDPATMVAEWESILECKVPVLDIPGNHFEPFDPRHVGEVSARLVDALGMLS